MFRFAVNIITTEGLENEMSLFGKKKNDKQETKLQRHTAKVLSGEAPKPKLLLHVCCGPCATYPLEKIAEQYEIMVLFYNPNITDIHEYNLRRQNLEYFLKNRKNTYPWDDEIKMIDEVYDPQRFYGLVKGFEETPEGGERCQICIAFRMEATAMAAAEYGFDYFGTTLSVSPYKNSGWIQEIGEALEEKYHVRYLNENFKKNNGYARSREISIEYRLYRQDYCGCSFSKLEMKQKREEQEKTEHEEKARLAADNRLKESDIMAD